jgi:hypothetical protein
VSFEAMLWASKDAPTANPIEKLVLIALGEAADEDGCNGFLSKKTLAERAHSNPRTVQNHLQSMRRRGLIREGDQTAAAYIDPRYRPTVYDLQIPYSWFGGKMLARVNEFRARAGRPALTPETRPELPPAGPRKPRSDKGQPNPKRSPKRAHADTAADLDIEARGESDSPLTGRPRGESQSGPGENLKAARGVSDSPNPVRTNPPTTGPPSVESPRTSDSLPAAVGTAAAGEVASQCPPAEDTPGQASDAAGQTGGDAAEQQTIDGKPAEVRAGPWLADVERHDPAWPDLVVATWVAYRWWRFLQQRGTPPAAKEGDGSKPFLSFRALIRARLARGYTVLELQKAVRELYDDRHVQIPQAQSLDRQLTANRRGVGSGRQRQLTNTWSHGYDPDSEVAAERRAAMG